MGHVHDIKAQTHRTGIREPVGMKADCFAASHCLLLGEKNKMHLNTPQRL